MGRDLAGSPTGLGGARFVGFVPVRDLATSRDFYVETLGLALVEESPFAVVIDGGGTQVRLTQVPDHQPQPFTVAGWDVDDIRAVIGVLASSGVRFLRFDHFDQDDLGIWHTPGGDRVAWFADPDGNTLSLTQFT